MWLNNDQRSDLLKLPRQRERQITVLENDSEVALRLPTSRVKQLGSIAEPKHYMRFPGPDNSRVALAEADVVAQLRRICTVATEGTEPGVTLYSPQSGISASVTLRVKLSTQKYIQSPTVHGVPAFRETDGKEQFVLLPFSGSRLNPTATLLINSLTKLSMGDALQLKAGEPAGVETCWENYQDQFLYNLSNNETFDPKNFAAHGSFKPFGGSALLETELIDRGWKDYLREVEGKFDDEFAPVPEGTYVSNGAIGYLARQRVRTLEQIILEELRQKAAKEEVAGQPGKYEYAFVRVSGGLTNFKIFLPAKMPSKDQLKKLPFAVHSRTLEVWPLILGFLEGNFFTRVVQKISNSTLEQLRKLQREERTTSATPLASAEATGLEPTKLTVQNEALAEVLDRILNTGTTWTGFKHVKVDVSGVRGQALHTFARFQGKTPVAQLYLIENAGYGAVYTFPEYDDAYAVFQGRVKRTEAQLRPGVRVFHHNGRFKANIENFLLAYGVKVKNLPKKVAKRPKS